MTTTSHLDPPHTSARGAVDHHNTYRGDETKPSWRTTELFVYLAAVAGVLTAAHLIGDGAADDGIDHFAADKAWWYVTLLTIGYLVSRGLAKAGTRTRDLDPRTR